MRAALLLAAMVATFHLHAQTITEYRYWVNDDPATLATVSVPPGTAVQVAAALSLPTLALDYNTITVQFKDSNGDYSVPQTSLFTRNSGTVTAYRYWVNDDPSTLTTAAIGPATNVTLNTALALATLDNDYNTITVQFQESDGTYGVPYTSEFTKNSGPVNGYAYWIDDAIGSSTTGTIGPNNTVNLIADLPTATTSGTHFFTIRFSSANGTWTVPLTTQFEFFTSIDELPGISDLLLFPNPVTDELGLRISSVEARTLNLQVLDISGTVVRDLSSWGVSGTTYRNWDISDLAVGSYLLRITDRSGAWSARFVKQ
ncbi:MAG: T9SS type A sorting domain-containing protein [Flavobacteriales bacterium]